MKLKPKDYGQLTTEQRRLAKQQEKVRAKRNNAYESGRQARRDGKQEMDNPFDHFTMPGHWDWWLKGFRDE